MKDTVKNPIKEVERFALDRNIHKMDYNYFDYVASILEELVELAGGDVPKEKRIEKICSYYVVQISNKMCTLEHCCGMPQVRSGVGQEPTPMS